jgi:hypothetical protein
MFRDFILVPQLPQNRAFDRHHPKKTRTAPVIIPQGKKKNIAANPPTSAANPSRSF